MKIRQEILEDYNKVEELTKLAFEKAGLSEEITEHVLVKNLRKSDGFIPELSIVAEKDGVIIGHIILTKISILQENENELEALCLAPMSVDPEFQKQGVGSKLVEQSLEKAKELGYKSVIVLGHADYYPKFGFVQAKEFDLKCEFEIPDEYFFALELQKDTLKDVKGTVMYPDVFK